LILIDRKAVMGMSTEAIKNNQVCEEYEKYYQQYKDGFKLSKKNYKDFPDIVKTIMDEKRETVEGLVLKSGLPKRILTSFRSGKWKRAGKTGDYIPHYNDLVAFCVACDLDAPNAIALFESAGLSLRMTNDVHYAYWYLIIKCGGKKIKECNELLKTFGIEEQYFLRTGNSDESYEEIE